MTYKKAPDVPKTGEHQTHESFVALPHPIDINVKTLIVGETTTKLSNLIDKKNSAVRTGDNERAAELRVLIDQLEPAARQEWINAKLIRHGYPLDTEYVYVQPFNLVGWGENLSSISTGSRIRLKTSDVSWDFDGGRFKTCVYLPRHEKAYLVPNPEADCSEVAKTVQERRDQTQQKLNLLLKEALEPGMVYADCTTMSSGFVAIKLSTGEYFFLLKGALHGINIARRSKNKRKSRCGGSETRKVVISEADVSYLREVQERMDRADNRRKTDLACYEAYAKYCLYGDEPSHES